jgi:hypothetical protein
LFDLALLPEALVSVGEDEGPAVALGMAVTSELCAGVAVALPEQAVAMARTSKNRRTTPLVRVARWMISSRDMATSFVGAPDQEW